MWGNGLNHNSKPSPFYSKLVSSMQKRKGLGVLILGQIKKEFIYLVYNVHCSYLLPDLLIAGGFHGDEPAGPLAILKFLETAPNSYFEKANLSFLPCVNPVGFRNNTRHAIKGIKTNAGFCHPENGDKLSFEGKILMKHKDLLVACSAGGFLSLHEDVEADGFYIYSFSRGRLPDDFAWEMRNEGLMYFPQIPNMRNISLQGEPEVQAIAGFVHNLHDGSFEDFLYHSECRHSISTETPASDGIPLEKRIEANVALIRKFIELVAEGGNDAPL